MGTETFSCPFFIFIVFSLLKFLLISDNQNPKPGLMYKSLTYESEEELLNALRQGASSAFELLYRQCYRMVAKQVTEAGRPDTETEDVFQEVLVVLVRKVRDPEFQLTSKLSTYLFAIARNLIFKKATDKTEFSTGDVATYQQETPEDAETPEDREKWENQLNIVTGCLEILEEDCRRILMLSFYEKYSQAEIAGLMGYAESFVKVKKHRCLEYLRKKVKANPLFSHLQNDAS